MADVHLSIADGSVPLAGPAIKGSSLFVTIANSAKTILGAGILSLSWAFFYSTLWPGLFFTVLMCLLSAHGFYMLGVCSEETGMRAYGEIWRGRFGAGVAWLPSLVTLIFCLLAMISYLTICGDYMPRALDGLGWAWPPLQNRRIIILLVTVLLLPLHFLRDLSFLGCTSVVGTIGSLYTCIVLFCQAVARQNEQADWKEFQLDPGLFLMIPTVTFAFNGHFNAPEIYQQLERRSPERWIVVTLGAFGLCFLITCVCGVSGYIMFGSELSLPNRSNVLNAPELKGKPQIMVAYIATTFSVALGIPLYAQSARDSLELLWLRFFAPSDLPNLSTTVGSPGRRNILMVACLVFTLAPSMVVDSLGLITAIAGAVCASLIMFIFPSMMYLKSTSARDLDSTLAHIVHRGLPRLSIVIGAVVGISGVVTSALNAAHVDL